MFTHKLKLSIKYENKWFNITRSRYGDFSQFFYFFYFFRIIAANYMSNMRAT